MIGLGVVLPKGSHESLWNDQDHTGGIESSFRSSSKDSAEDSGEGGTSNSNSAYNFNLVGPSASVSGNTNPNWHPKYDLSSDSYHYNVHPKSVVPSAAFGDWNQQVITHPANPSLPPPKGRVLRDLGDFESYEQSLYSDVHLKGSVPIYDSPSLDSLSSFPHKNSMTPASLISVIPSPEQQQQHEQQEQQQEQQHNRNRDNFAFPRIHSGAPIGPSVSGWPSIRSLSDTSSGWSRSASASLLNLPFASDSPPLPAPIAQRSGRVNSGSGSASRSSPQASTGYKPLYHYQRPPASSSSSSSLSKSSSQIIIPKRNDRAAQEVRFNDTGINVTFNSRPASKSSVGKSSLARGSVSATSNTRARVSSYAQGSYLESNPEADWLAGRAGTKRHITRTRTSSRILGSPVTESSRRHGSFLQREATAVHHRSAHYGDYGDEERVASSTVGDSRLRVPQLSSQPAAPNFEILAGRDYLKEWEESPLLSASMRNEPHCSSTTSNILLGLCVFFPPLWLLLGVGVFDQVFGIVPIKVKRIALTLSLGFFVVVIACIIVGLVVG